MNKKEKERKMVPWLDGEIESLAEEYLMEAILNRWFRFTNR